MSDLRVWTLLAMLAGCVDPPAILEPDLAEDGTREVVGVPLMDLIDAGRQPAGLRPAVLDRVSEPDRVSTIEVRNRHDRTRTDTLTTWSYDGVSFTIHRSSTTGRERMQRVEVTGADHRTADGLRVGMTREAVVGIRGQPTATGVDADIYRLPGPYPGQLRIGYDDDLLVSRLTWVFSID